MSDFDIFQWANQADFNKKKFQIDLFLFSKAYTPYIVPLNENLEESIRVLFLYDIINAVELGGATGLAVRDFADGKPEAGVLLYSELERIENAKTLVYLIEGKEGLTEFSEHEHELKRMKGLVARFEYSGEVFYIVKQLQSSQIVGGKSAWQFGADGFKGLNADVSFKIPADSQVLIAGGKVFAFNPKKFLSLFGQNPSTELAIEQVSTLLVNRFKLSCPEGVSFSRIAKDNKTIAKALMKININALPTLEDVVERADELDLALMTDQDGGVIIMDNRDAAMFVNLLSDNYVDSNLTGAHYLATNKKLISGDAQLNMNI